MAKYKVKVKGKEVTFDSNAKWPLGTDSVGHPLCRCCGNPVRSGDEHPIHTKCIPKHWGKHAHGINAGNCKEFGHLAKKRRR